MFRNFICFFLVSLFCAATYSADTPLYNALYFNAGTHTEFYNVVQTDDSGTLRKFEFAPTLGVGFSIPTSSSLLLLPEINWVLPQRTSEEILKNLFMLRLDLGYEPLKWLRLRGGTSLMWLNQHGTGGTAQINNGNSTSTFYYPDENRSSLNNTLDFGVEAFWSKSWSARLQTYNYAVFREERRQLSYSLFLTYYWERSSK